jgi:tetratricopeptide (TPR) repeat protein
MSLLIKALETAEKDKQAELKKSKAAGLSADLALEPLSMGGVPDAAKNGDLNLLADAVPTNEIASKADAFNASAAASVAKVRSQSENTRDSKQKVAANVFVANQALKNPTSKTTLALLGVAGALIIWFGLYGYQYIRELATAKVVVIKPPPLPQVAAAPETANPAELLAVLPEAQTGSNPNPVGAKIAEANMPAQPASAGAVTEADLNDAKIEYLTANNAADVSRKTSKKPKPGRDHLAEDAGAADENSNEFKRSAPLKLVSKTPVAGIDPTLLAAYQAFSRGDDAAAQKQYRQVLQADVRNIDALLGMAAIALRQGRYADANGWYQKVLEIEPRNSTALSALANAQIGNDATGSNAAGSDFAATESRIKNLLAQQPEAANLHAALGNVYAAQNQWPLAQAAYFDASRFAPNSADYAFNLAVSLDQLGKSELALAQYQRALSLLNNSGASNLDRTQLEARIQALQP